MARGRQLTKAQETAVNRAARIVLECYEEEVCPTSAVQPVAAKLGGIRGERSAFDPSVTYYDDVENELLVFMDEARLLVAERVLELVRAKVSKKGGKKRAA